MVYRVMKKDIIKEVFIKFFKFTNSLSSMLMYLSQWKACLCFLFLALLVFCYLVVKSNPLLGLITLLLLFGVIFISVADTVLTSVWRFMTIGTMYWLSISLLTFFILTDIFFIPGKGIVIFIFAFIWIMYSLVANNKVATLVNQIHSTILALIVLSKDLIMAMIPNTFLEKVTADGQTAESIITKVFFSIFSPFLAVNLIALLLCLLKGYWIEKYNNNQDVGNNEPNLKDEVELLKLQNTQMAEEIELMRERLDK